MTLDAPKIHVQILEANSEHSMNRTGSGPSPLEKGNKRPEKEAEEGRKANRMRNEVLTVIIRDGLTTASNVYLHGYCINTTNDYYICQ